MVPLVSCPDTVQNPDGDLAGSQGRFDTVNSAEGLGIGRALEV